MLNRILILGGAGFIGYNIAKYFSQQDQYQVFVTFHKTPLIEPLTEVCEYQCNLLNDNEINDLINFIKPHIVIQAAATTSNVIDVINKPYYHVTDNVIMNSLLFRRLHNSAVQHVFFLSCSVMYKSSPNPQSEADWHQSDMNDAYFGGGTTKVYLEQMCNFYSRINPNIRYTVIRHPDIYGPYDKTNLDQCHMYAALFQKILAAKTTLDIWGTKETKRDLLYIDDLASFIQQCILLQSADFNLYNCGSENLYDISRIANTIMKAVGKKLKINFQSDKPNIERQVLLDCTKAHRDLLWYPTTCLYDGTRQVYEWYKNQC